MPSSWRCPARLPAARHLCASVIAENCCNGDQTLCKSFFACPSLSHPTGQSKWLFLWPFLFVFHIVCFLAPQLLTASWTMPFHMYTLAWVNVCLCVCVCVLHYFYFTFGAGYLLGLLLHVLYIFIKLAPFWLHVDNPFGLSHISLALRVTRFLSLPPFTQFGFRVV